MSNYLKNINVEGLGPLPDSHFLQRRNNGSWEGMNSYSKAKSTYIKELQAIVKQMAEVETTLDKLNAKMVRLDRSFRVAQLGVKDNNENTVNARRAKSVNNSIKKLEKEIRNTSNKKYRIEEKFGELYATDPDLIIQKKINEFKRTGKNAPINFLNPNSVHEFYGRHVLHQGGTRKKRS
jgi:hypothetical protein